MRKGSAARHVLPLRGMHTSWFLVLLLLLLLVLLLLLLFL